jgi:hypothetical protein
VLTVRDSEFAKENSMQKGTKNKIELHMMGEGRNQEVSRTEPTKSRNKDGKILPSLSRRNLEDAKH